MGQDFVNHYSTGIGDNAAVIVSRRAACVSARTPGVFLVPTAQVIISGIYYRERETLAVSSRVPAVFVAKIQNGLADGIFERDSLAGVVQPAGVLACYIDICAVSGLEGVTVLDDYCIDLL
jgi:hypothetical protein